MWQPHIDASVTAVGSEVESNASESPLRSFEVLGVCSTSDVADSQLQRGSGILESPLMLHASCSTSTLTALLRSAGND